MPSMRSEIDATEKHVPAWKKLGLKLKYAKDEPETEMNGNWPTVQNGRKRKLVSDETTSWTHSSPKKLKAKSSKDFTSIERTTITTSPPREASHPTQSSLSPSASTAPITPSGSRPKRKSVTFTPETKTEDGDSIKNLYRTWLASHRAVDPTFDPFAVSSSPALRSVVPPPVTFPSSPSAVPEQIPNGKKKKKGKSKSTLLSKQPESQPSKTTIHASPASTAKDDRIRTYITTYHISHSSWKFSKSRQNSLLRFIFSLSKLPSSYDSALLSYLRGLQGGDAKSRVRKMALQVRADDEEWLKRLESSENDKATRRADYKAAVARVRETLKRKDELRDEQRADEEWESRFYKRRRAEVVLWGVGEVEDYTPPTAKITAQANDTNAANGSTANSAPPTTPSKLARNGKLKRRRKYKARPTGVPDDDESSSSSDSSNSSSSSEDDERRAAVSSRMPKKAICDEDTSTEETSSSSPESEDEDEDSDGNGDGDDESVNSSGSGDDDSDAANAGD